MKETRQYIYTSTRAMEVERTLWMEEYVERKATVPFNKVMSNDNLGFHYLQSFNTLPVGLGGKGRMHFGEQFSVLSSLLQFGVHQMVDNIAAMISNRGRGLSKHPRRPFNLHAWRRPLKEILRRA
jgi:hypothetical protein